MAKLTKKQKRQWEARARERLSKWVYRLRLSNTYAISPKFDWEGTPDTKLGKDKAGATAHVDPVYLTAQIELHMRTFVEEDVSDAQIDEMLVHELVHVLLGEIGHSVEGGEGKVPQAAAEAEERACELISRRFVWMWKDHDEFGHPKWDEE